MDIEALENWAKRTGELAEKLVADNPALNPITAQIMAGDLFSAEQVDREIEAGELTAERGMWLIGSYARWEWVLNKVGERKLPEDVFLREIANIWSSSDPNDEDPNNLKVWRWAFAKNEGVIRDGRPLPKARRDGTISIYRGGLGAGLQTGIAWTTDPKIARKFAMGAGVRVPIANGVVITGDVRPSHVLAYVTGRGESEVIVDPRLVANVRPTGEGR